MLSCTGMTITMQTLHAVTARLRPRREIISVRARDWVKLYQAKISSPQSCINEWNEMSDILVRIVFCYSVGRTVGCLVGCGWSVF